MKLIIALVIERISLFLDNIHGVFRNKSYDVFNLPSEDLREREKREDIGKS